MLLIVLGVVALAFAIAGAVALGVRTYNPDYTYHEGCTFRTYWDLGENLTFLA